MGEGHKTTKGWYNEIVSIRAHRIREQIPLPEINDIMIKSPRSRVGEGVV
jgi:hypothetical protein